MWISWGFRSLKLFQRKNSETHERLIAEIWFSRVSKPPCRQEKKTWFSNNFSLPPREGPIREVNLQKLHTEPLFSKTVLGNRVSARSFRKFILKTSIPFATLFIFGRKRVFRTKLLLFLARNLDYDCWTSRFLRANHEISNRKSETQEIAEASAI